MRHFVVVINQLKLEQISSFSIIDLQKKNLLSLYFTKMDWMLFIHQFIPQAFNLKK